MLKQSRKLVDERQKRHGRRRFYAPRIKWATWLFSGGEQDEAMPPEGRKANRQGESGAEAGDDADEDPSTSRDTLIKSKIQHDEEKAMKKQDALKNAPANAAPKSVEALKQRQKHRDQPATLKLRGQLADLGVDARFR